MASQAVPARVEMTVRLAPLLHAELSKQANANGRSLNAEIAYRLKQSLEGYSLDLRR